MATIDQMQKLVTQLSGDSTIPGLTFDNVVESMVENNPQYKTILDSLKTKEEREAQKKLIVDSLKQGSQSYINEQINAINSCYQTVVSGTTELTKSVATLAVSLAAAISNPLLAPSVAPDVLAKKSMLLTMCQNLIQTFLKLLQSAVNIFFPIPESVIALLTTINGIKETLELIPV